MSLTSYRAAPPRESNDKSLSRLPFIYLPVLSLTACGQAGGAASPRESNDKSLSRLPFIYLPVLGSFDLQIGGRGCFPHAQGYR